MFAKLTNTSPSLPSEWQSSRNAKILVREKDGVTITAKPQQERMVCSDNHQLLTIYQTAMANNPFPVGFHNVVCYFEITVIDLPKNRCKSNAFSHSI